MSKILIERSVVEQALDALEDNISYDFHGNPYEEGDELMQVAAAKLSAALEQPQTVKESLITQPQVEQEPFAWISPRALEWGTRQSEKVVKLTCKAQPEYDFTEPLYTHPQPKREPLCEDEGCPHHGTAHVYIN